MHPIFPVLQNSKSQSPWKPDWLIWKFNSNMIFYGVTKDLSSAAHMTA